MRGEDEVLDYIGSLDTRRMRGEDEVLDYIGSLDTRRMRGEVLDISTLVYAIYTGIEYE